LLALAAKPLGLCAGVGVLIDGLYPARELLLRR
jgi:hypothetical protein